MPKISRRGMLGGLGAGAATLPFLRSFPTSAHGGAQPKLLLVGFPNGCLIGPDGDAGLGYDGWRPPGFSGSEAPLGNALPHIFEPLEDFKDKLLFLENLTMLDDTAPHRNCASMLTGRQRYYPPGQDEDNFTSNGISVDQHLAQELGTNVLNTGCWTTRGGQAGEGYWSYTGPQQPVTAIFDPAQTYERVYGEGLSTPGLAEQLLARRTGILDHAAKDVTAMRSRVPAADRERLDAHLAAIEAVEQELADNLAANCEDPADPPALDWQDFAKLPEINLAHAELTVQALACGWGRVATIQASNFGGAIMRPEWPDFGINESVMSGHNIAHAFAGLDLPYEYSQAEAVATGLAFERAFSTIFARILEMLDTTDDVDGNSLLHNTLVAYMRPMGLNHDGRKVLWIVAGGEGVGVRGGRFMKVGDGPNDPRYFNDFLTGVCHSMGAPTDTFGDPAFCQEPIDFG